MENFKKCPYGMKGEAERFPPLFQYPKGHLLSIHHSFSTQSYSIEI